MIETFKQMAASPLRLMRGAEVKHQMLLQHQAIGLHLDHLPFGGVLS
jgi:hypothetical protein